MFHCVSVTVPDKEAGGHTKMSFAVDKSYIICMSSVYLFQVGAYMIHVPP